MSELLPGGWVSAPLSEFASNEPNSFVDGPFGSDLKVSDYAEDGVRILQLQNLGDGHFINDNVKFTSKSKAATLSRCLVKPGDLIIAKMAEPLARACIVPEEVDQGLIVADLIKLRLNRRYDSTFIASAINGTEFRREAERLSTGTTRTRISLSTLKKIHLKAPSQPEQQYKIGELVRTLDEAIEQTEALIAKMQQVKAGLMHDLFTRGVTPDGRLRPTREQAPGLYKESPLGWIPEEWDYGVLNDFSDIHNNLRKPISSEVREAMQGDYPYYGPTGVIDYINEFSVEGEYCLIGEDGDHFLKFVEWSMTILVNGRFNVNNHAHILSGRNGATTRWLHAFFQHRDITFHLTRQGAGRYKLNKAALKALPLCVPRSVEQQIILDRLGVAHLSIENQSQQLTKLHQQKQGLMHDLLTGRVLVPVANAKDVSTIAHVPYSS